MYLLNEIKNCNVTAHVTKLIIYTPIRCYTVIAKVYIFQEKMYSCDFKNCFQYDQLPMKALIPKASVNGL